MFRPRLYTGQYDTDYIDGNKVDDMSRIWLYFMIPATAIAGIYLVFLNW